MATKLLPRFYSTKGLPEKSGLVPISPQQAARPYEAMSQAGEKIEGLGLHAANVFDVLAQKERQAIRQTKVLELGESLDNDFNQLTEELSTLSDYEKFVPEMEKKKNAIKEKYLSQLNIDGTPDRDLTFTYEKMFSTKSSQFMNDVRRKKLMIITERGQAALFKDLDKDLANYAMATDEGTKLRTKNDFEIKVELNVGTLLTADQAHALVKSFDKNTLLKQKELIEEAKGTIRIAMVNDPPKTYETVKNHGYDALLLNNQAAIAELLKETKAFADQNKPLELVGDVKEKYGWIGEKNLLIRQLEDPQYLKEKGATLEQGERAITFIKGQIARERQAKEDSQKIIQNDFISRLYDNKKPLDPGEVNRSSLEPTGDGSKAYFNKLIEDREKALIEKRNLPYTTTNGKVLADLLTRQNDPNKPPLSANEILSLTGRVDGISVNLAQRLIETSEVTKDEIFKYTDSTLKSLFGYEGILTGFGNKQIGSVHYSNTVAEILGELSQKPLKGSALKQKMFEIATPHLMSYWRDINESDEDIKKKMKLMGISTSPSINLVPPTEKTKLKPPIDEVNKQMTGKKVGQYQIDGNLGYWDGLSFKWNK